MAVIWVPAPLTEKVVAAVLPKSTAVAPVKFVPVMTTLVPPPARPLVGLSPVTVGAHTVCTTVIDTVAAELVLVPSDTAKVKLSLP